MNALPRHLAFCLFAGLYWPCLSAQAAVPADTTLTLAAALQRAAENNPALAAQRFDQRAAEALIEQARFRPNPTLDASFENFLGTDEMRGARGLEATVQASQLLERGGKRERRVTLATREREMAAHAFAVQRAELAGQTAEAYIAAVVAGQNRALAAEPLRLAERTLADAGALMENGAASSVDVARARAAVAGARVEVARADARLMAAKIALSALWAGSPSEAVTLPAGIQISDTLPDEAAFRSQLAGHPQLALQRAVVASRRSSLELERSRALGDVTVGGGVRFFREGNDAALVAGVSMPLPVRNKNQGNIRAARETLAGAEESLRAVEAGLHARFTVAWAELTAAHAAAQSIRRHILPANEEVRASVARAHERGELPLADVLEAERALAAVRREMLEAEAAYATALVRVESLVNTRFPATAALLSLP